MKRRSICATMPSTVSTTWPNSPRVDTCGSRMVTNALRCSHSCTMLSTSRVSRPNRSRRVTTSSSPGRRNSRTVARLVAANPAGTEDIFRADDFAAFALELGQLIFEVLINAADASVTDAGYVSLQGLRVYARGYAVTNSPCQPRCYAICTRGFASLQGIP
jgi:hypothetical protein